MTLGATNGVKVPAWRSQARQNSEPTRDVEPGPSRFESLLASSRPEDRSRQKDLSETRRSEDNTTSSTRRQDKGPQESGKTRPNAKDDPAPSAQKTDASSGSGQDQPAKADPAQPDTTGETATATPAKSDASSDTTLQASETKGQTADPTMPAQPIILPLHATIAPPTQSGASSDETAEVHETKDQAADPTMPAQPIILPLPANAVPPMPMPTTTATPTPTARGQAGTAGIEAAAQGTSAATAAKTAMLTGRVGETDDADDSATASVGKDKGNGAGEFLAALSATAQGTAPPDSTTNAVPSTGLTGLTGASLSSGAATHTAPPTTPEMPTTPPVPLGQVPMTIGLRSLAGSSEFQIRLDPAELGRIDVTLEIDKRSGTVATHLIVDRPDTLAMLQRDAGQLQQALTQAGLDPSAGGINLSLRGDGGQSAGGQTSQQQGGSGQPNGLWAAEGADTDSQAAPMQLLLGYGGLDIRI